jgi:hypothetical protein
MPSEPSFSVQVPRLKKRSGSVLMSSRQRCSGLTGTIASLPSGFMLAKIFVPTRNEVRSKWGSSVEPGIESASFRKAAGVMEGEHSTSSARSG